MVPAPPPPVWQIAPATPRAAQALAAALGLPPLAGQLLCHRGISNPEAARAFLDPSLERLPPPEGMLGLEQALEVLIPALEQGLTIGVAGDYDADGITATALLVEFFGQCGAKVVWDLPHRLLDGYGFRPARAQRLAAAGAKVVVTADCGISDHEGVAAAHELGLRVVVTDHHLVPPGPLVPAAAVVNPKQEACGLTPHLAGVGVSFYLAAGLRAGLRRAGFFDGRPEPNLRHSLDLVALGTCADVVPLVEANRVLVSEGLKVLNERRRPGLAALAQAAGRSGSLDTMDLGFYLAPRINAAGRLEHPAQALELLLAPGPEQAAALAQDLNRLNSQRRDLETAIFEQALEVIAGDPHLRAARCLVLGHEGWHRGVLGIVAGRLLERTGRPSMLFSMEKGLAVGSGRSLEGFHLQRALAANAALLDSYGGHALAAGATLASRRLPELARALEQAAAQELPPPGQGSRLAIEAQVSLAELGPEMIPPLLRLAPHGIGNPEPMLAAAGAEVSATRIVGDNHLKMELIQDGALLPVIAFNQAEQAPPVGTRLEVAFIPRVSNFGRPHIELVLKDMRPTS
ncbi:MAG: single-stranded-DNA-specific exonuclease RecJ [Desulfarculus sp.]|nr:MAG: single-stranded-DNA-specific exonuclease RecJ [Desulfarculus sp.]